MHYYRWLRHGDPLYVEVIVGDDESRFLAKIDQSGGPAACWPWTDGVRKPGYGQFYLGGKTALAHIFAYELMIGPVPDGLELDHRCHDPRTCVLGTDGLCPHRRCCNPAHLEPVTHRENSVRAGGTKLDDRLVVALYARWEGGETIRALAEESGVAKRVLWHRFAGHAARSGITRRETPAMRSARITGERYAVIGREFLECNGDELSAADRQLLEVRVGNPGFSMAQVGAMVGLSDSAVRRRLKRLLGEPGCEPGQPGTTDVQETLL